MSDCEVSEVSPACPFCGSTRASTSVHSDWINCYECSAEAKQCDWNNRPLEDALQKQVRDLKAQLLNLNQEMDTLHGNM